MQASDIDLTQMLHYRPELGKVMLGAERMLVFRQQAMSTLRRLMFEQLGGQLSRTLISQFRYQCGAGDYANMAESYDWDSELDLLASGPVLHTWEGIVKATPTLIEYDRDTGHFDMRGEWANSYEAEIHREVLGPSDDPVCYSLTGYASGWATRFFSSPVLCIERTCVGRGDDVCRFELRDTPRWGPEADPWAQALASTQTSLVNQLEQQLALVRDQQRALEQLTSRQEAALIELSTPIMEVWDGVMVLPLIGMLDEVRSIRIMTKLLDVLAGGGARCLIIDVTGVGIVDTATANHLLEMVEAARLLGVYCVITGIGGQIARTLVTIGANLASVPTLRDMKAGLRACLRALDGHHARPGWGP